MQRLAHEPASFEGLHCPFTGGLNPATATLHEETAAWSARFGLATTERAARASEVSAGLVSRFFPQAPRHKLRVLSDWTTWLFWLDDQCDGTELGRSPRKVARLLERYMLILDGTARLRPDTPFELALNDVRGRLASIAPSRAWFLRFLNTVQDYLAACVWEADNRAAGRPLDVNLFIGMRRQASDMYSYVELIDWLRGRCLPLVVRRHRDVVALVDCTNNVASWTNDLFSLPKELRDHDVHNLVVAIANEQHLSLDAACSSDLPVHTISAKNYSRACTNVLDCVPVYEGPIGCCGGGCPNTAIRADLATQYMTASAKAAMCNGVQPPCPAFDPNGCPGGRVNCDNGICHLEMRASDAGANE